MNGGAAATWEGAGTHYEGRGQGSGAGGTALLSIRCELLGAIAQTRVNTEYGG